MNKSGLASGLLAIIIVLFLFGLMSLLALVGWSEFNDTIQDADNSTIAPHVKTQIDALGDGFLGWGDKIFVWFFIALIIGFMVTSFTVSTDNSIYIALYLVFLVFTSIVAMIVSNGWSYLVNNSLFSTSALSLPFTTWFMTYLPIVTFFIGIIGGLIFYARKKSSPGSGYNLDDGLEGGGGFEP